MKLLQNRALMKAMSSVTALAATFFWFRIEEKTPRFESSEGCVFKPSSCTYEISTNWFMFGLSAFFVAATIAIWVHLVWSWYRSGE